MAPTVSCRSMGLAGATFVVVGLERLINASLLQGTIYAGSRLAAGLACTLIGSFLVGAVAIVNLHGRWPCGTRRSAARLRK